MAFCACQKDDSGEIAKTPEAKPDVYLENDYLAFKNMNAVDSVIQVLNKMTRKEKEAWEQKMGVTTARHEFDKLFDEYDKIDSKDGFLKFKAKYASQLKFNESDEMDCSINYPYEDSYYASVMNKKGIFKVGLSLFKQTLNGQVIALDGNRKKLDNPAAYLNDKTVFISTNLKSTSGNSDQSLVIYDFAEFDPSRNKNRWWINDGYGSDRKLLNELKVNKWLYWETTRIYNNPVILSETRVTTGYRAFLRQYGLKKSLFGWNSYYTNYICNNLVCQVDGVKLFITGSNSESPEVKPEYNWEIKKAESTYRYCNPQYIDSYMYPTPSLRMEADLSCRGFDGRLTHVKYNLPFTY